MCLPADLRSGFGEFVHLRREVSALFDQAAASVFGLATSTWIIGELDWHVEAFFGYGVPG